jgi:hypothetical protein
VGFFIEDLHMGFRNGREIPPPDSLRRRVDDKIGQIIQLLNGSPPNATYDWQTLGILLEYAVSPNSLDTL